MLIQVALHVLCCLGITCVYVIIYLFFNGKDLEFDSREDEVGVGFCLRVHVYVCTVCLCELLRTCN